MLYFQIPGHTDKEITLKVDADMWWSMPYHEDARTELRQAYMPDHPDYRDFGVTVSVVPFTKEGGIGD